MLCGLLLSIRKLRVSFTLLSLAAPCVLSLALEASTSHGIIVGHRADTASSVLEWLGVPYAQPPVGSLRFAAPVKIAPQNNSKIEASDYSASCPVPPQPPSKPFPDGFEKLEQIVTTVTGAIDKNRAEDCLTLNIWSKDTETKDKAVIVFFYGGRFTTGSTNTPFYNGAYLAESQDVVVVTMNFRSNIFGYPGAPNNTQNLGLLDQRLAVEWVRDNIRAFGGDPAHIVISGQSSGAVAVDYWAYAYAKDPIVTGFIQNSGNAFTFGNNDNELAQKHWYNVSSQLGCGDSGDTLPCMRAIKNFSAIEAAAAKIKPPPGNPGRPSPIFQPTPDNITIFTDYKSRSEAGNHAHLPFLVGFNDHESSFYKISAYNQGVEPNSSVWDNFDIETFACPIGFAATNRAKLNIPGYIFVYAGNWPNLQLYPECYAYHTSDINMVLGVSQDVSGLTKSKQERVMESVFMKAWGAFARDPKDGLTNVLDWPKYELNGTTIVRLGYPTAGKLYRGPSDSFQPLCRNVTING